MNKKYEKVEEQCRHATRTKNSTLPVSECEWGAHIMAL